MAYSGTGSACPRGEYLKQLDTLGVVRIFDARPRDALLEVFLLLELKYMLVEVGLEMLVGVVDT